MERKTRRTHPALTPERIAQLKELAHQIDRSESEQIKAEGRAILLRHESVRRLIQMLKQARIDKKISLAEVEENHDYQLGDATAEREADLVRGR